MTEEIGLLADLDLTQWDLAVSRYMQSIEDMKKAAEGIAGSVGSGFSGLDLSLSNIASSVSGAFVSLGETVLSALTSLAQQIYADYQELGKNLLFIVTGTATAIVGAVAVAGKGLVDWTVDGISANTHFEQSISDIASVLRTTREAVTPLANEIDTLALDPKLVVSTQEASAVVEQLARNGLDMTEILDGAAKASILLANSVGNNDPQSFAQAADVATMAMQEFNLKASDMTHLADVSQGVINGSRLELNDWALALGNGGAAAGEFNVSLDDFATAIAGTVNLYHSARQAGTGLTNFLERLVPLTTPAADEMRKLGIFSGLSGREFDKLSENIAKTEASIAALDPTNANFAADQQKLTDKLADQKHAYDQLSTGIDLTQKKISALTPDSKNYTITLESLTKTLDDQTYKQQQLADSIQETQDNLNNLSPTSDGYKKRLAELTTKLAEQRKELNAGNNAFFDAQGNMKDLATVSEVWKNAISGLSDEQQIEATRTIFGNDALETAIGFANLGSNAFSKLKGSIVENGSAAASAATRTQTLAAHWANLQDIWEAIQRKSGAGFNTMLLKLVDLLTQLTNANQDRVISFFNELANVFSDLIDAALPWVEQMLPVFLDNLEALAHWLLEVVKSGNPLNDWLNHMSPWLKGFVEGLVNIVAKGREFIGWLIETGKYIWKMLEPYIEWIKQNISLKDVLIAAAGAIAAFVLPAILRMVSIANLAIGAVAAIRHAWETDWMNIRTFFETVWPKIEQPLFDFINDFLTGQWGKAWDDAVKIVSAVVDTIVGLLNGVGTPLALFIADILQGKWQDAWTIAVQWAVDRLNDLKTFLPSWGGDFLTVIQDLLQGNWQQAWTDAVTFVEDTFAAIGEFVRGLDTPFTNFIADVLQGKWAQAWIDAGIAAYALYTGIVQWLLDLQTPFTDFIALILQGDWKDAWTIAQQWVVEQLDVIKGYLPAWAANIITVVQDLVKGDWSTAWLDAANAAHLVYTDIVQWLLDLNTPFSNFIALILEGQWQDAWTIAQQWVITQLETIKAYLPNWGSDFISIIEALLTGDWNTAWINAQKFVTDVLSNIGEAVRGLNTPFTTFIADVLEGKWEPAWKNLKELLGLTDDKITLIIDGVTALGIGMGVLALGGLADIITGFLSWIAGITAATISISPLLVTLGLLASAYYLLTTPVKEIITDLEKFQSSMLDIVNNTEYPTWLRAIFADTVAGAAAIEEWTRVLGLWKGQADISFGSQGASKAYPDALTQLATSILEIGQFFEMAGLEAEFFTIKLQMMFDAMRGLGEDTTKNDRLAQIQDRIGQIRALLSEDIFNTTDLTDHGNAVSKFIQSMFGSADMDKAIADVGANLDKLKTTLDVHYLSYEEAAAATGKGSIDEFSKAFVGPDAQQAQLQVLNFTDKIAVLAAAIKDGFYSAGDGSVQAYVKALADKNGIAEDGAMQLAQNIISTYGSHFTDIGGIVVPESYQKTFVDPLTGLQKPSKEAGIVIGDSSISGVTQGVAGGVDSFLQSIQGVVDGATTAYDKLVPASKDTGTQAVGALGQGTTDNQSAAINPMQSLIDQANKIVADLTPASGQTGKDSVTALGVSVDQNKQPTLDTIQTLISNINDKSTPMIQNMGDVGTSSSDALVQPYVEVAPGKMQDALGGLNTIVYTWAAALIQYMNDSGKSTSTAFSTGLYQNEQLITDTAEAIGKSFRDKINEYLTIVINNFVNLADNIQSLTDFQKFTDLGTNIGNALKSGLDSKLADVQASGAALVAAAATGVTTEAEIASPSKLFERFADFIRQGFMIGMNKPLDKANSFSSGMVNGASANLTAQLTQKTGTINPVSSTANYSNTNAPITIINNIYNQMDQAQLQYMMQQTLNGASA